jgi:enoyl-CoA hydratase/carnithine racemase
MMKQALKHSLNSSAEACLELMASFQAIVQRTSDHFEGVDAILEKRQPQFQGK